MTTASTLAAEVALRIGDPNQTELTAGQYLSFINMAMDDLSAAGWLQPINDDTSLVVAANTFTYTIPAGFAYIKELKAEEIQSGTSVYTRMIPEAHWEPHLEGGVGVLFFSTLSSLEIGRKIMVVGQKRFTGNLAGSDTVVAGAESFVRERAFSYAADALSNGEDEQAKRRGRLAEQSWIKSQDALKRHPQEFRVYPASRVVPTLSGTAVTAIVATTVYNVQTYGAKGDGVTDDTLAILAAYTAIPSAGGILYFPAGTYPVTSFPPIRKNNVWIEGDGATTFYDFTQDASIIKLIAAQTIFVLWGTGDFIDQGYPGSQVLRGGTRRITFQSNGFASYTFYVKWAHQFDFQHYCTGATVGEHVYDDGAGSGKDELRLAASGAAHGLIINPHLTDSVMIGGVYRISHYRLAVTHVTGHGILWIDGDGQAFYEAYIAAGTAAATGHSVHIDPPVVSSLGQSFFIGSIFSSAAVAPFGGGGVYVAADLGFQHINFYYTNTDNGALDVRPLGPFAHQITYVQEDGQRFGQGTFNGMYHYTNLPTAIGPSDNTLKTFDTYSVRTPDLGTTISIWDGLLRGKVRVVGTNGSGGNQTMTFSVVFGTATATLAAITIPAGGHVYGYLHYEVKAISVLSSTLAIRFEGYEDGANAAIIRHAAAASSDSLAADETISLRGQLSASDPAISIAFGESTSEILRNH